jgi:hypothetical protein
VQLVRITGPTEPMRRLAQVAGLDFERTSARRVADDRWQVSGYASDEALTTLAERGLQVEPVVDADDLSEQRSVLFSKLDDDRAREARAE